VALAGLYYNTERYKEALSFFERSLKIVEKNLALLIHISKPSKKNTQILKAKMEET